MEPADVLHRPGGKTQQPATDLSKQSKAGRLKLVVNNNTYATVPQSDPRPDLLRPVFRDGVVLEERSLIDIREWRKHNFGSQKGEPFAE